MKKKKQFKKGKKKERIGRNVKEEAALYSQILIGMFWFHDNGN
jgi:hypothetical protein